VTQVDTFEETYDELPAHPLDEEFELVRLELLGAQGTYERGPFQAQAGGDDFDENEDEGEEDDSDPLDNFFAGR
jgi:hypothetical protein